MGTSIIFGNCKDIKSEIPQNEVSTGDNMMNGIKANELNIYIFGSNKQIYNFEKFGNFDITEELKKSPKFDGVSIYPKYNWIYFKHKYTDELMKAIIEHIKLNYKQNKENGNIILIILDYYKDDINFKNINNSILNFLDKSLKLYRPVVILASKKKMNNFKSDENEKEIIENDVIKIGNNKTEEAICKRVNNSENTNLNIIENKSNYKEEKYETGRNEIINENNNDQTKNCENLCIENQIPDIISQNKDDINNSLANNYIEYVYYKEDDFSEIIEKIYSLYCYFNNIGDIYSIIDEILYESEMNLNAKQIKYQATINILVLGRPGGGKSTLINLLLNERKAREGIGNSTTKLFSKYIHSKYPITFVDTPGFENDNDLNKMINFLNQTQTFFGEGKNKFHLVLYVINSSNERCFIGEEKKLISHIYTKIKIPIFFVCTRAQNENYASDFKEIIKVNLKQNFGIGTDLVEHIYCCHLFDEKDGIYKRFGVNELLQSIQKFFINQLDVIKTIKNIFENGSFEPPKLKKNCNQVLLSSLNGYDNFKNYLSQLSDKIINNYGHLSEQEEKKRLNFEKVKNKKNRLVNIIHNEKINELLVKHLSFELSCDPSEINIQEIINAKIGEKNNLNKPISENLVKSSIKTEAIGKYTKNILFEKIKKIGFNIYFQEIINDYQKAV